jgi:hypothetical protein
MNSKLNGFLILMLLVLTASGQISPKSKYSEALKKLSNERADFFVSNPVRIKDSSGQVIAVRNLIVLENEYMNKVARKYGNEIVPDLVGMLQDTLRDWAANLLLYNITNTDAVVFKYYPPNDWAKWRKFRKHEDVLKWEGYLKNLHGRENSNAKISGR